MSISRLVLSLVGRVITTKKEELVAITDHCNIQIDNPVSLLNQDTSRNFLHNSKPTAKYKLFMKATHLEQIALDYQKSREEQDIMHQRIDAMATVSDTVLTVITVFVGEAYHMAKLSFC